MPQTALALYVVYFLAAFVVRGVVQWRRTGDSGFRMGAEAVWSPQWWARLAFVLALLASAFAPILALVGWLDPLGVLDHPVVAVVGLGLALVGLVATSVAQIAMGASWRVGVDPHEQTDLVLRWPFTIARNPIFTAMAVAAVGFTLLVPNLLAVGALALLACALRYQVVVVEEPYLRRTHGEAYERYAARVGRFVPGVGLMGPDGVRGERDAGT